MKMIYIKPETYISAIEHQCQLMSSSSVDTNRVATGDPYGNPTTDGLPTDIVNVDGDNTDPYGGHGQDGNTNRSKETYGIWDDFGW
jgi:hypothetical protein